MPLPPPQVLQPFQILPGGLVHEGPQPHREGDICGGS